eukprot:40817-Eustigmatos_ZCMA.PRE.1
MVLHRVRFHQESAADAVASVQAEHWCRGKSKTAAVDSITRTWQCSLCGENCKKEVDAYFNL